MSGWSQCGEDDVSQNFIFLEDLIDVEPLRMSQRPELHCLCSYRSSSVEVEVLALEVIGNTVDQKRDVVQQLIGRKDLAWLDCHSSADSLEPPSNYFLSHASQLLCEELTRRLLDLSGLRHWRKI